MATNPPEVPPSAVELPELAELLADQFEILDDVRPTSPRVVEASDDLTFTFVWPFIPADALLARSPRRSQLIRLRELLLEEMTSYLAEVVEIDRHRTVNDSASALGGDPREATVSFTLGPADTDVYGDDAEAIRNWAAQVRRHAREERRAMVGRRAELRRLRGQLANRRRAG